MKNKTIVQKNPIDEYGRNVISILRKVKQGELSSSDAIEQHTEKLKELSVSLS